MWKDLSLSYGHNLPGFITGASDPASAIGLTVYSWEICPCGKLL